jgi:alpha-L-fucosidase 2
MIRIFFRRRDRPAVLLPAVLSLSALALLSCQAGDGGIRTGVDWADFLGRQDPVWEALPEKWTDAPFLGNGALGTLVRRDGEREVRWDVGNSWVHDHRGPDDYSARSPEILNRGRLPVGHFVLETEGAITGGTIRLDLWNAEARGIVFTEKGAVDWRTLVHAGDMVFLIELAPRGGEKNLRLSFVPEKAESTRFTRNRETLPAEFRDGYLPNPDPVMMELGDGILVCEQRLASGGSTATAWITRTESTMTRILVSCVHAFPEDDAAARAAAELLKVGPEGKEFAAWIGAHRAWWHRYYAESFLSLSDPVWESFYWIQMYKLASATRADRALIDNQGPWLQPTPWNGTWWNLNVQLSYSPVPASNRLDLAESLTAALERNFRNLVENVDEPYRLDSAGIGRNTSLLDLKGKAGKPGGWEHPNPDIGAEAGNLAWVCHNLYTLYRSSLDESLLRDLLYPLLKRAVNYTRHFLVEGPDGKLHLPPTHSPEYGNAPDANYDLSLLRWGCRTLVLLSEKLGADEGMIPAWREIEDRLVAFPENEYGFMVGRGVGFDRSHRHWSHLLMIYPLRLVNPENGGEDVIRKSFARWHGFPEALAGYSYTVGGSFAALLRDGNTALDYLTRFRPFMGASTMYSEGGEAALPVMETPLHAAAAVQEMLLQSWGDRIRVFPAVPEAWADVIFHDLRAEGAFLVSAARKGRRTLWVRVKSLAGEPCLVDTDLEDPRGIKNGRRTELTRRADGLLDLVLAEGEEIVLVSAETKSMTVTAVSSPAGAHPFGLKK